VPDLMRLDALQPDAQGSSRSRPWLRVASGAQHEGMNLRLARTLAMFPFRHGIGPRISIDLRHDDTGRLRDSGRNLTWHSSHNRVGIDTQSPRHHSGNRRERPSSGRKGRKVASSGWRNESQEKRGRTLRYPDSIDFSIAAITDLIGCPEQSPVTLGGRCALNRSD
jgi:hypothetical protein